MCELAFNVAGERHGMCESAFTRRMNGHCLGTSQTPRSRVIIIIIIIIIMSAVLHITPTVFSWQRLSEAWVRYQASSCEVCGTGTGFLPGTSVYPYQYHCMLTILYIRSALRATSVDFGLLESKYTECRMNKYECSYIMCIIVSVHCSIRHME
jgi:hypothetical protein